MNKEVFLVCWSGLFLAQIYPSKWEEDIYLFEYGEQMYDYVALEILEKDS